MTTAYSGGLPPLMTYDDVRRVLRCSRSTLEKAVARGELQSVLVGSPGSRRPARRFRPEDVEAYVVQRLAS